LIPVSTKPPNGVYRWLKRSFYYAFKQSEIKGGVSTGWETFLDAVLQSGFGTSGTWPMRTELGNRMIGSGANSLASSIVVDRGNPNPSFHF
jgi:adenine-specific DNA methylase